MASLLLPLDLRGGNPPVIRGPVPLSIVVTNGKLSCAWPVAPGKWELQQCKPPYAEWNAVPSDQYTTNGYLITSILPIPAQTTMFRVGHPRIKRSFGTNSVPMPPAPPVLPEGTNRLRLHKPPADQAPPTPPAPGP